MSILVYKILKKFKDTITLQSISFHILKSSLAVLLGPSGSGKSTLLRIIAGLDTPDHGSIWLKGKESTFVPPQFRHIGFVFQNYALFSHMNVRDNIVFGVKLRQFSISHIEIKLNYLLDCLRISDIKYQFPNQLSGGQKQRVALARSLIVEPEFLLLDEPFGSLDGEIRRYLNKWLKEYLKYKQITAIMVTHDHKEAITMADEVLILNNGYLIQQDKPHILYDYPINKFVGIFFGAFVRTPNKVNIDNNLNQIYKSTSNEITYDYEFFIRPHEISLFNKETDYKYSISIVKNIIYKKQYVELELLIKDLSWNFKIQVGYFIFEKLQIRSINQIVYIKPRSKIFQRAYPIKK